MASMVACQASSVITLSRSTPSSKRIVAPASAFFAPELHASLRSTRPMIATTTRQRKQAFVVRGLFGLGVPELAVIAGVAALLFGPKQLPQLGKKLGQSVKSFQEAAKEFETEVRGDSEEAKAAAAAANGEVTETKETIKPTPVATPSGTENSSKSPSSS